MDKRELSHIPLFEILTDDELQWLLDNTVETELSVGDYFIREGDPAEQFYVVLEGELQVVRTIDGVPKVMGTTPRGIIGGELAILNGTTSMITAKAIQPSRLIVFNKRAFAKCLPIFPRWGLRFCGLRRSEWVVLRPPLHKTRKWPRWVNFPQV